MSSTEIDAIVNRYFSRLEALLAPLPSAERDQLLAEIHEHVDQARAGLDDETPERVHALLDRVGRPEDIAAEALGESGEPPRRRRLAMVSLAIVVIGAVALALGLLLSTTSAKPAAQIGAAPTASVGGFPTGIAYDPASGTVYVGSGVLGALGAIDARSCNATTQTGCGEVKTIPTGGTDAIGVAVDDTTGTVYAVNGGSQSVAVIDASNCNAQTTSGCAKTPQLVQVPGGPGVSRREREDELGLRGGHKLGVGLGDRRSDLQRFGPFGLHEGAGVGHGGPGRVPDHGRRDDQHRLRGDTRGLDRQGRLGGLG